MTESVEVVRDSWWTKWNGRSCHRGLNRISDGMIEGDSCLKEGSFNTVRWRCSIGVVQRVVSLVMLGDGVFGVGDDVTWRQWAYVYRGGEDVHWRTICHLNNALLEDLCHRGWSVRNRWWKRALFTGREKEKDENEWQRNHKIVWICIIIIFSTYE